MSTAATEDPLTTPFHTLNDLAPDLTTLTDLASRGLWRTIVDKVSHAKSHNLLPKPHHLLTYTAFSILALTKLRRFTDAIAELDSLDDLDSPTYRYESYPDLYSNRSGSMVPFVVRWVHALIPIKTGQRQEGLDRLYMVLDFVRGKILEREKNGGNEAGVNVWRKREVFLLNYLVGQHLSNKEFSVGLSLLEDLLKKGGLDPVLVSKLGYVQMQIGDLDGAKGSFDRVEKMLNEGKSNGSLTEVEFRNLVSRNKALVYLVGKDYVSAVREYEECIERDSTDVVAINNKALCLLYSRDLSDSIKVLENVLERLPTAALTETLVVNLCSMYELAYVNHSDVKKTLSSWIARVAPDDFDTSCTRT